MNTLDRWQAAPFDAVTWALFQKNRRAARELLERRGSLSWVEGSEYAPWTLGWAPDLLELILDLVPQDGEELFCQRLFVLPGGVWLADICAGLLTAAAALDDLSAVELLLSRGYQMEAHNLYRSARLSPHFCELGRIRSNTQFLLLNHVFLRSRVQPVQRSQGCMDFCPLEMACPLSAAIFFGAVRCTRRLLEQAGGTLNLSARHALILANRTGQPTAETVTAALGQELDMLLEPEDFYSYDRTHPLFLQCLRLHGSKPEHRFLIQYLVSSAAKEQTTLNALDCVDPVLVSSVLMELLHRGELRSKQLHRFLSLPGLRLVLDRNTVPPTLDFEYLTLCLDRAQVVGEPPEGELSGLAAALLQYALQTKPQLWMRNYKLLSILEAEDPDMVTAYLRPHLECGHTSHAAHLIQALLNIRKEDSYDL